jgi:hypothetical protein
MSNDLVRVNDRAQPIGVSLVFHLVRIDLENIVTWLDDTTRAANRTIRVLDHDDARDSRDPAVAVVLDLYAHVTPLDVDRVRPGDIDVILSHRFRRASVVDFEVCLVDEAAALGPSIVGDVLNLEFGGNCSVAEGTEDIEPVLLAEGSCCEPGVGIARGQWAGEIEKLS